jgi:FG-GAP-like repeat/FG-GAP repeat
MASVTTKRWVLNGLGVAAAVSLASCGGGGDDCHDCFNPGPSNSSEVSYGLTVGDFTGNGLGCSVTTYSGCSVIETSVIDDGRQPNPGQLNVYLASGPNNFLNPTAVTTGNNPTYLVAADMDLNGLPDVVSANQQDGKLQVFLNGAGNTAGAFAAPVTLDSPGASQLAVADMNGDGLPDLISADFNVSLFQQTSPGVFANPIALYSGGANWVAAGDLDGDGFADVALTDNAGVNLVFRTGVNTYSSAVQIYQESSNVAAQGANIIAIRDVNGDGFNDLIITDPGPGGGNAPFVSVLLQDATHPGNFLAPVAYATTAGSQATSIEVQDIDGDGYPDIIIGGSTAITVLVNHGSSAPGTFFAKDDYAAPDSNQIALADVNGDGLPDIVTTTGVTHTLSNGVYLNSPGVLLQDPANIGFFKAVQDLP